MADPANLPEVLFGVGLLIVFALWWVPKGQAAWSQGASEKNRFDRENEARKTLAQIVGGVLLLAGLYSSTKTFDLQQQGQITDRFTKAIDQLGAVKADADGKPIPNLEVRLGGIYALERIAKDSPKDQWTIMEVLTAYVRQNAPKRKRGKLPEPKPDKDGFIFDPKRTARVCADIQAVLTVIGRRDTRHDLSSGRLNLTSAELIGVHLSRADLGGADFSMADLSYADLSYANLAGADLRGSYLTSAELDHADLKKVRLSMNDDEAHFIGGYVYHTDLSDAHLDGADLSEADLRYAHLMGAHLIGADLRGADLRGVEDLKPSQVVYTIRNKDTKLPPMFEKTRPRFLR